MGKLYLCMAWAITLCLSCQTSATIVDFEDLSYGQDISDTNYQGVFWEFGNEGLDAEIGSWIVPFPSDPDNDYYNYPHSGIRNLINRWGCTEISFRFPVELFEEGAKMNGAYFSVQGDMDLWAESIIVKGFKDELEVWTTEPLVLSETPEWLAMESTRVDHIMIYVTPLEGNDYGWFGMDDLTFNEIPEPMTLLLLTLGAALLRRRKK